MTLLDLFEGRRQLIVYHFMFDPAWEKGCPGCTGYVDALGDLSMLAERDTSFVLISRAPLAKLEAYKKAQGLEVAVVFLVRQRLQLRLPRDAGRERAPRRVRLSQQGGDGSSEGAESRARARSMA